MSEAAKLMERMQGKGMGTSEIKEGAKFNEFGPAMAKELINMADNIDFTDEQDVAMTVNEMAMMIKKAVPVTSGNAKNIEELTNGLDGFGGAVSQFIEGRYSVISGQAFFLDNFDMKKAHRQVDKAIDLVDKALGTHMRSALKFIIYDIYHTIGADD